MGPQNAAVIEKLLSESQPMTIIQMMIKTKMTEEYIRACLTTLKRSEKLRIMGKEGRLKLYGLN